MARVAVVFTGGTISTAFDPIAGGNVPTLDGAAILARTPGLETIAEVVAIDRGRTPASHFTFPALLELAGVLRDALADPAVDGAVVVQGTDTIEETSFLWDLVLDGTKPVVVTGAMRASDAPGFDGPANLRDAVLVAAAPSMRGAGVVVCLAGTVEPADDVVKVHASALDTFASPNGGSLGRVEADALTLFQRRGPRRRIETARAAERVHLITATVAMDGSLPRCGGRGRGRRDRRRGDRRREHGSGIAGRRRTCHGGRDPGRPRESLHRRTGRDRLCVPGRRRDVGPRRGAPGRAPVRGQGSRRAGAGPRRRARS